MKKIVCLILSVLIACSFWEIYLHTSGYSLWIRTEPGKYPNQAPEGVWYEQNSKFGWVYNRKNNDKNSTGIFYQANRDGFRDSSWDSFNPFDHQTKKILVFGDSQAAGYGVREEDRFSNVLGSLFGDGYRIYNFAVAGWGFDQMYLAFQEFVPIVKPNIVVVVYINNDLLRSLESYKPLEKVNKPSFEVVNNELKLRQQDNRETFGEWVVGHIYLVNFFYKVFVKPYLARELNKKIAEAMVEIAKERNIKIFFIRIPPKDAVKPPSDLDDHLIRFERNLYNWTYGIKSHVKRLGATFVPVRDIMREKMSNGSVSLYLPNDSHLNPQGHRLVAEVLFREIQK